KLSDDDKADIDAAKAARLMAANPSMIKRPVIEGAGDLIVGFDEQVYADRLT
ncbi:MAG: arsenate reductase, partial [Novosphingopyxis baekryungensis]|nr:arsenate reductase [Novosphingopyxis baekryungensis]